MLASIRNSVLIVFCFFGFFSGFASAQSNPVSDLTGVVQDTTGAVIPGAAVTLTNVDTGAVRTDESNGAGEYSFNSLAPGSYKLEVAKAGFRNYQQVGIVLQVNSNPKIVVQLPVGVSTETLEVRSDAAMVETQSVGVGQVIGQAQIVDLPLNGRNPTQLITLSGAAVSGAQLSSSGTSTAPGGVSNTLDYPTAAAFSLAGGQANATNYFLDGAQYMDVRTNLGLPLPYPDALREFKVETSSLAANFGTLPSGAVTAITRSGTNSFHGGIFEFIRNGAVNARNHFSTGPDVLKRNQFGGQVGGPIQKNKLFFFAGVQVTTLSSASPSTTAFVPTAQELAGNFTACPGISIKSQYTNGTPDVLNPALINPIAVKLATTYLPASTDPTGCGKISYAIPQQSTEYQGISRIDYQRTANDAINFRVFIADYKLLPQFVNSNILTAATPGLRDRVTGLDLGDNYVLTQNLVSSARVFYSRQAVQRIGASGVPTPTQLGVNVTSPIANYLGQFAVSNYFSTAANPGYIYTNTYGVSEDLNWAKGKHSVSMGFAFLQSRMDADGEYQQNGVQTYNGTLTGNALADFITGNLDTFQQGNGQIGNDRVNTPSAYVQDNWKITQRLQINAGLRWDPFIPQRQLLGYASDFSLAGLLAGTVSKTYPNAPAGVTFPGDAGFNGLSDTDPRYGNFAPRVGVVFDPGGKGRDVIRAGYGLFYSGSYLWQTMHVPLNAPWGNTLILTAPAGGINNPYAAYPGGNPFPTATPSASTIFPLAGAYVFEPQHIRETSVQQYNLAYQRQIGRDWSVSATYLGNVTIHPWLGAEMNPGIYSPGATTATTQARRLFNTLSPKYGPYFGSTIQINDSLRANYNGLLLSANHRFDQHFTVIANYTWSHCLNYGDVSQDIVNTFQNPSNPQSDYANCVLDRRNIANVSVVAETPTFQQHLVRAVATGWSVSGIYTFNSGPWVNVTDGTDVSLSGLGNDRPNVTANPNSGAPRTVGQWFNTAAFTKQAAGTFGNASRNDVLGPSIWDLDMGLWRNFSIERKADLLVRFEAFNLFNNTQLAPPVTALNSSNLGKILVAGNPRILQAAIKINF
jgi:hypothetical protein